MKTVTFLIIFALCVSCAFAIAGENYSMTKQVLTEMGYAAGPALNTFNMFKHGSALVGIRHINSFVCEGFMIIPGETSVELALKTIRIIYVSLLFSLNTPASMGILNAGMDVIDAKTKGIFVTASTGLSTQKEFMFSIDGMVCKVVDSGEISVGSQGPARLKLMSIKLFLP